MLPEWLDAETLRNLLLLAVVLLLFAMYSVLRFVRRLATRVVLLVLLGGLGIALWLEREDLDRCARTCSCELFGADVDMGERGDRFCGQRGVFES